MLCSRIWQKQLLILKFEKGFFGDQTIFSWLQNTDQVSQCQVKVLSLRLWKSIQNWTKSSFNQSSSSLSITIQRFRSFWTIFTLPWNIWNVHLLMDLMFATVKTGAVEDSNGSLDWSINEIVVIVNARHTSVHSFMQHRSIDGYFLYQPMHLYYLLLRWCAGFALCFSYYE